MIKNIIKFLFFFLIIWAVLFFYLKPGPVAISYSDFKGLLKAGKIAEVTISDNEITASLKSSENLTGIIPQQKIASLMHLEANPKEVYTPRLNDPTLIQDLEKSNVQMIGKTKNNYLALAWSWFIPGLIIILLFVILFGFLLSRLGIASKSLIDISKSKARVYTAKQTSVTFKDVAGVDEAKHELIEIVEFLKNPRYYRRLGAHAPKGVLLIGPPGTGKTLLARAVAGEAKVPFLSINGSEFVELYVGVGAARVRDLFQKAHMIAPSIIFIDEIDALGRQRDQYGRGSDEKEHTLNQLLSEIDGFDPNIDVILLAATNRPELLDPALLRTGRFDRQVLVDRPDKTGRLQILGLYLNKIQGGSDIDPDAIAELTPGFTGADLAALVNEAALLATRRSAKTVSMHDFIDAVERFTAGLEKKQRLLNPNERLVVAHHEMGHVIIAFTLPGANLIQKVSIVQRGMGTLGYNIQRPLEERYLLNRDELITRMTILLGGHAAEFVIFGQFSTNAADELTKATQIARYMVMRYGMSAALGPVVYDASTQYNSSGIPLKRFSEKTAQEIDREVSEILQKAFDHAVAIIKKNRALLEEGADLLLKKETLDQADLKKLWPNN